MTRSKAPSASDGSVLNLLVDDLCRAGPSGVGASPGIPRLPPRTDPPGRGWRARAGCARVDPDLFFPPSGMPSRDAVEVCRVCRVRVECLRWALQREDLWGIWGGLTRQERARLRQAVHRAALERWARRHDWRTVRAGSR